MQRDWRSPWKVDLSYLLWLASISFQFLFACSRYSVTEKLSSSKHIEVTVTHRTVDLFSVWSRLWSRIKTVSAVSPHPPGEPVVVRMDNNPGLWLEDAAQHWPPIGPPRSVRGLRTEYWSWTGHVTCSWLLASVEAALVWPSTTLDRCTFGWQKVFSSTCRPSSWRFWWMKALNTLGESGHWHMCTQAPRHRRQ